MHFLKVSVFELDRLQAKQEVIFFPKKKEVNA